jgi:hypothetical protein
MNLKEMTNEQIGEYVVKNSVFIDRGFNNSRIYSVKIKTRPDALESEFRGRKAQIVKNMIASRDRKVRLMRTGRAG